MYALFKSIFQNTLLCKYWDLDLNPDSYPDWNFAILLTTLTFR